MYTLAAGIDGWHVYMPKLDKGGGRGGSPVKVCYCVASRRLGLSSWVDRKLAGSRRNFGWIGFQFLFSTNLCSR